MAVEAQLAFGVTNGIVWGLTVALMASGLTLILGLIGIVNIAHGEFYMLGAVAAWFTLASTGNFWLVLVIAPVVVGVLGMGLERLVLRPIEHRPLATVVATVGILLIIQQATLAAFGGSPRQVPEPVEFTLSLFGYGYPGYRLVAATLAAVILTLVWMLLHRTALGLRIRAAEQNRELALAHGIRVSRMYLYTFAIGVALAALGGAVASPIVTVHFLMGLDVLVVSFMVVIVGGLGSLRGAVTVALLVGVLEGVSAVFLTPAEARIFTFLVLAAMVILRAKGPLGEKR
ncbi:MAG: branched-chain amino acid ABC transporter permease [Candidatus Bathyarchaeia archaeon]